MVRGLSCSFLKIPQLGSKKCQSFLRRFSKNELFPRYILAFLHFAISITPSLSSSNLGWWFIAIKAKTLLHLFYPQISFYNSENCFMQHVFYNTLFWKLFRGVLQTNFSEKNLLWRRFCSKQVVCLQSYRGNFVTGFRLIRFQSHWEQLLYKSPLCNCFSFHRKLLVFFFLRSCFLV